VTKTQVVGAVLWRGGALLVVVAALFESVRWILRLVDVPTEMRVGLGLLVAGFVLVLGSLVVERIQDFRVESDLRE
jgi:hypothetical protein